MNKTEEGSVTKSIKFPVVSSVVISHSYQKKWAEKARQDTDIVSVDSRWFGKSGYKTCGSHFLLFPSKASSATKGEFVLLTETDQMKEPEMFGAVQVWTTASHR